MKEKDNYKKIFTHLHSDRSFKGNFYRQFLLYPRLDRNLKGEVLDIGCGIGHMLRYRKRTIGCDINPFNIDYCKEKKLEAYLMKPDKLPFKNGSFDSVLLDNVLEHLASPNRLIEEIKRVLKPGGIIVIGVPGLSGYKRDSDHKFFYDEKKLALLASRHNFKISHFFYMPFLKSNFLDKYLKQYCIYTIWSKVK